MQNKNMKLWVATTFVLALVGCATQPVNGKAKSSVLPEQVVLSISVAPRIGLFNESQFTRKSSGTSLNPSIPAQWTRDDYKKSIPQKLRDELPPDWDLLTTGQDGGYASRRIDIAVSSTNSAHPTCQLSLVSPDGKTRRDISGCGEKNISIGNGRLNLVGTITTTDQTGRSIARPVEATVPEDHLIVSVGDSFASGEGNPDRVHERDLFENENTPTNALWMDERCHRSAWAGPIRAGLSLIRESQRVAEVPNGIVIKTSGAYTIASVACSGATLNRGVLGPYEGRVALSSLAAKDPRVKANLRHYFDRHKLLDSQITQVAKLMESQEHVRKAWENKKIVDAVVVSVGGNDIYFANLVSAMLLERLNSPQDKSDLAMFVQDATSQLPPGFSALNTALNQCKDDKCQQGAPKISRHYGDDDKINAFQVLITAYPNPTRRCVGANCYCSGAISKGFIGAVLAVFGKKVTETEAALAETPVLQQLNDTVAASATRHGWRYVKHDDEFLRHGWCLEKASGDPYASSQTWFRDTDDSERYQGDFYGTMHPSWEGHEAYMKIIRDALQNNVMPSDPVTTNEELGDKEIALLGGKGEVAPLIGQSDK